MQPLDPRLAEIIAKFHAARRGLKNVPYAVGGALAMQAHGVRRYTSDLDVFIEEEHRFDLLRALRKQGFEIMPVFEPHHYVALLPQHADPSIRIDVLVPADDPEVSAIHMAQVQPLGDELTPVFSPEMLVLAKFYSDQPGARDDIARMLNAGIVDRDEAVRLLSLMDEQDARDLASLFRELAAPKRRARPRRK